MNEIVQSESTCPSCGGPCTETMEETEMSYGAEDPVTLLVHEIVITCSDPQCGETFCDYRAEEARDKAVQAYRRVFAEPFVELLGRYLPFAKVRLKELMLSLDSATSDQARSAYADLKIVDAGLAAIFIYEPPPKSYVIKDWVYAFIMARLDELMFADPGKDTPQGIELTSLVAIAEQYEREQFPGGEEPS